ncbi:MAG: hypothetical protein KAT18_02460 [Candidatus Latescibacteria bacterium]|nr:hypothetical protein [Candidatus Latescibacterota bacterium]
MDEQLLCFNRELLPEDLGVSSVFYDDSLWNRILDNLEIVPRSQAETDYTRKQLVAYILVRSGELILTYKRTPKTNEQRLRELYSIGIGGHVNVEDRSQFSLFGSDAGFNIEFIRDAAWREIDEEISIESKVVREPEIIGFINDDSNDVGRVHFGIVWLLEIEKPEVSAKGARGLGDLGFNTLPHLLDNKDQFESWSRLLIEYLIVPSPPVL